MMFTASTFICFLIVLSQQQVFANIDERSSIVKIYTVKVDSSYNDPWRMNAAASGSGSGCVITWESESLLMLML